MEDIFLSKEEIKIKVNEGLSSYEKLDLLGSFAMYMGKAQLLEFGLKNVLVHKFDYTEQQVEKMTLGFTRNELLSKGMREDYGGLLKMVVDERNNLAHEFFLNLAIVRAFSSMSDRKFWGQLFRASNHLEQALIIYDFLAEHDAWLGKDKKI